MKEGDPMDEHEWLAVQFEANRGHLRAVAYRMLGSLPEADDAVQEAWLRLSHTDATALQNLGGWLTTTVARVCLDQLRARRTRREDALAGDETGPLATLQGGVNPEDQALLADSVGLALLVVLETLNPAERLAFVLHDLFDVPFDEIAPIVGRTPTAARQLASRARRRVRGTATPEDADLTRHRAIVDAFFAASRAGDFDTLLALLDPDVVLRADATIPAAGALSDARGAAAVARQLMGRARGVRPALIDGHPGAVWAPGGQPQGAFTFSIRDGRIIAIDILVDPARLAALDIVIQGS